MDTEITSPLTFSKNIKEVGKIESAEIIDIYAKHFNMDVKHYFINVPEIKIMQCLDTKYDFYYPFNIAGDKHYYEKMGAFDWYYNPLRWEHSKIMEILPDSFELLEVGAGSGHFLKHLKERFKNASLCGLELNDAGIESAAKMGIDLQNKTIEEYAKSNDKKFDIVCSFQVLEHIYNPHSFIDYQIKCLKKGGKLIIGVPNNDSFISENKLYSRVLNMPPHHMGLWKPESIKGLENIFDIKFKEIYYEPLVISNVDTYMWNKLNKVFFNIPLLTNVVWKFGFHKLLRKTVLKRSTNVKGHSMLVVFEKQ